MKCKPKLQKVTVCLSLSVMSHQLSPAFLDLSNRLVLNEASSQLHCRCALDSNRYFEGSKEALNHIEWICDENAQLCKRLQVFCAWVNLKENDPTVANVKMHRSPSTVLNLHSPLQKLEEGKNKRISAFFDKISSADLKI